MSVTITDTMRWLHDEGLVRLAGVASRRTLPIAAYTVDITDGTVTVHPTTGAGPESEVLTMPADDLPFPIGTRQRLVIAGVTASEAMLVVNLAATHRMLLTGDHAQAVARSWVLQLLLNSEVTLTTNSPDLAIDTESRCRIAFIPGAPSTTLTVDDHRAPTTSLTLGGDDDLPDRLETASDGSGALYLGARYWPLRVVHHLRDTAWTAINNQLNHPPEDTTPVVDAPNT
ncbi:hypothetical protein JK358_35690 [Nocardia sp. 2]|uniref:Urease accessory protein n=1 Tax=Nocardia acididurans TaxID=2802282 RepID=A0ABS1MGH6_9NOCA|nr:hypothetical protein [Nocardia acididurans]MBL1079758.1 hypothetical protein [Nocardia acididurans]